MSRPLRVAMAGVGNWGRLHAETLVALGGVCLVAVCDPDAGRRAVVCEAIRQAGSAAPAAPAEYESLEACLREADLDAAVIATRDEQHAGHAIAALERGCHVFVEKPLALSLRDARAVQAAAARSGRLAMVGTILRFSLPHRQLVEAVRGGRLGRVLHVRGVRSVTAGWLARTSVHTAIRLSVHDIDLVLWITGRRVVRVAAVGHTLPDEDRPRSLVGLFWMSGGASAVVETHYLLPPAFPINTLPPEAPGTRVGMVEVFGEQGVARLDDAAGLGLWTASGAFSPDLFVAPRMDGRTTGALRAELEHFVLCAAEGIASSVAPLADAVHGIAVAEAMVRAQASQSLESVEEKP